MTVNKSGIGGMRSRNNATRPRQGVAAKELQAARRKKRQREVMRNRIIFGAGVLAVIVLIIFFITKLIGFILGSGKSADTSTLTLLDDGQILFEEVVDFDTDTYSKSELKTYTKELIDSFNETYGSDVISLDKPSVKGDKAYIKTTYKDADCYSSFTSYEVYSASYEDATAAGYEFGQLYSAVNEDSLAEASVVNADTAFAGSQVLVVNENITVVVPGTITYVSNADVSLDASNTVTISQADGNEDATDLVYIIYSK